MLTFSNYVVMIDEDDWKEHYPRIRNNFMWDKGFDPPKPKKFPAAFVRKYSAWENCCYWTESDKVTALTELNASIEKLQKIRYKVVKAYEEAD